jgi:hypothetical protein
MSENTRIRGVAMYIGQDLCFPEHRWEKVDLLVRQGSAGAKVEDQPFPRKLDLWAMCIGLAVAKDLPVIDPGALRKFISVGQVKVDDDLISLLEIVAVRHLGVSHKGIGEPREVVRSANWFAAAGLEDIIEMLVGRPYVPLDFIVEELIEMARPGVNTE